MTPFPALPRLCAEIVPLEYYVPMKEGGAEALLQQALTWGISPVDVKEQDANPLYACSSGIDVGRRKDSSIACQKQRTAGAGRADILNRQARGSVAGAGTLCSLHQDRVIRYRARNSIAAAVQVISGSRPGIHPEDR